MRAGRSVRSAARARVRSWASSTAVSRSSSTQAAAAFGGGTTSSVVCGACAPGASKWKLAAIGSCAPGITSVHWSTSSPASDAAGLATGAVPGANTSDVVFAAGAAPAVSGQSYPKA